MVLLLTLLSLFYFKNYFFFSIEYFDWDKLIDLVYMTNKFVVLYQKYLYSEINYTRALYVVMDHNIVDFYIFIKT